MNQRPNRKLATTSPRPNQIPRNVTRQSQAFISKSCSIPQASRAYQTLPPPWQGYPEYGNRINVPRCFGNVAPVTANTNHEPVDLGAGRIEDRVGPLAPVPNDPKYNQDIVVKQTWSATYKGTPYPISTEFEQITHIQDGNVTTNVVDIVP